MGAAIKAAIGLAVIIEVISIGWFAAGLHENMMLGFVFVAFAILLNVLAVVWALRQTRAVNGYGKQLLSAIVLGVVGGVLIFLFSMVNMSVLFPEAFEDQKAMQIEWIESMGMPEDTKAKQVKAIEESTPASSAVQGPLLGTVIVSVLTGAITAAFVRRKNR
jgi:hypothetical protein